MKTNLVEIQLKKGREKSLQQRHPWIFSGAIEKVNGKPQAGDLVQLVDSDGRYAATAYYNAQSQIQARILTWAEETIDETFWRKALQRAFVLRQSLALEPLTNAYRLVNAEADGLPGLVVDKYGDYLVMQCLTAGIDCRKEMLSKLLVELLQPRGIVERSDVSVRRKEGLKPFSGVLWGEKPEGMLEILENGHRFGVDLLEGQKTGFYLDQRTNRTAVAQAAFCAGKEILNAFCYTGGFSIYAAAHNPAQIINLDSSQKALEEAENNLARNGLERAQDEYIMGDAFQVLRYYQEAGRQFDTIIIDPPKFATNQGDINKACRGYQDLNRIALRLLRPGGTLATFSCSGLVSAELFRKVIFSAGVEAQRDVQVLAQLTQAPDHPFLLAFPESYYLKGLLCRIP